MVERRSLKVLNYAMTRPRRLLNLGRHRLQARKQPLITSYLPYVLDIEPTTARNFRCKMCQVSTPGFQAIHMRFDLFKKILDENPQLAKIKLQGMGEPFTCPEIFKMIEYATRKKILIEMTSNGSLFTEKMIGRIVDSTITSLTISMDGATRETFEKIRKQSDFEVVRRGVTDLIRALRDHRRSTEVTAWTVLQRDNIDEAPDLVRLCHRMGFSSLTFQIQLTGWARRSGRRTPGSWKSHPTTGPIRSFLKRRCRWAGSSSFPPAATMRGF